MFVADERPYKQRLETLLRDLPPAESDAVMMLTKESRGAWALLLERSGGPALFCGNALSGTPVALATLGFDVTIVDRSQVRLRFARDRADALVPGSTRVVLAGIDACLPFADMTFDVVVLEDGLPGPATGWGFDLEELRRIASHELIVTADNRLGYKRSTGRRGSFLRDPRVLVREILWPSRGEKTLPVTRARVRANWSSSDAYALYPHAREFSHVVALDRARPRLTIGRRERENKIKMFGYSVGLFRWLTPSFAVHARRRSSASSRLDRLLDRIADETGEARPEADILVATRSNDVLVMTALPERHGHSQDAPEGRWAMHIALQPTKRRMVRTHHDWLTRIRADHPGVPVPKPLFHGDVEGATIAVERRLGGMSATDVTGDDVLTTRMYEAASRHLRDLVDPEPTTLDAGLYSELLGSRFELVARLVGSDRTRREVRRMADRLAEQLIGRDMRLAIYHADLRGKHLQVDSAGDVIGYLDWGASEARFLPFVDLMHLIVHQRKQETDVPFGDAWRLVRDPVTRKANESAALSSYAESVGLDESDVALLFDAYPLFVAGMAELNWDYTRPDWLARQFRL